MPERLRRILVAEDDSDFARFLKDVLEEEEEACRVIVAASPAEALLLLADNSFDLVLTDGFSTTAEGVVPATAELVRAAGTTPIALLTAHAVPADEAHAAGFRDVIGKPFDLDALLQQVQKLLTT